MHGVWVAMAAIALVALAAWLWMRPQAQPVKATPKASIATRLPAPAVNPPTVHAPVAGAPAAPPPVDTAKEMRAAGWDETILDGGGCMMDRRGERDNGLNSLFIYSGQGNRTYELSFTSPLYENDDNTTLNGENAPDLR